MNTSIMYSTIALGLAATLYAAENPALNIETGGTLLLDDFEDGDLVSKYGPWKFSGDFASDPNDGVGESAITPKVVTSEDEGHSGKILQIDYSLSKGTYRYDPFVQAHYTWMPTTARMIYPHVRKLNMIIRVRPIKFV